MFPDNTDNHAAFPCEMSYIQKRLISNQEEKVLRFFHKLLSLDPKRQLFIFPPHTINAVLSLKIINEEKNYAPDVVSSRRC